MNKFAEEAREVISNNLAPEFISRNWNYFLVAMDKEGSIILFSSRPLEEVIVNLPEVSKLLTEAILGNPDVVISASNFSPKEN